MYVFYVNLNNKVIPINCESWKNSDFKDDFITLENVQQLQDSLLKDYKVIELTIEKSNVKYFSKLTKTNIVINEATKQNTVVKIKRSQIKDKKISRDVLTQTRKTNWDL